MQLARAVSDMHRRGVIHRDITPANIVVAHDGAPCLVDFPSATSLAEIRPEFTHHTEIVGTRLILPRSRPDVPVGRWISARTYMRWAPLCLRWRRASRRSGPVIRCGSPMITGAGADAPARAQFGRCANAKPSAPNRFRLPHAAAHAQALAGADPPCCQPNTPASGRWCPIPPPLNAGTYRQPRGEPGPPRPGQATARASARRRSFSVLCLRNCLRWSESVVWRQRRPKGTKCAVRQGFP